MEKLDRVQQSRTAIQTIKIKMRMGTVTYDEAKELIKPHLEILNVKGKEIAKKYQKKYMPLTFNIVMRG